MCGIAGFSFPNQQLIKQMTDAIQHRGPDAEGFFVNDRISLGHRRLSILDLSEKGKQPMSFNGLVICYNGEVYNYLEIKQKLKNLGHQFQSDTDTEILLHAYQEWGQGFVNQLNGMWAFCIYDPTKNLLFISRDRYGIKPLYFYHQNKKFIFSSELQAITTHNIPKEIDLKGLNTFFYQKYIYDNQEKSISIFKHIHKLPPAHNLIFKLDTHQLKIEKYYDLTKEIQKAQQIPIQERLEQIPELIEDAVEKRLIADVPVGSFLSGGVDSSLISAIIARKKSDFDTFSIGFQEKTFNETEFSRTVAEHIQTRHHVEILDLDEQLIPHLVENMDEPFGDPSILPTFLLSKMTRKHVTVALSGDAADELFGGYDSYKAYQMAKLVPNFVAGSAKNITSWLRGSDKNLSTLFKVKKFFKDYHPNVNRRHLNWMSQTDEKQRQQLFGQNYYPNSDLLAVEKDDSLLSVQMTDMNYYLIGDILKKTDMASMLNSLEVRVPFLDYRLVPLALSLPPEYKIKRFETKHFLKELTTKYVPESVVYRPKKGFAVPLSKWLKESQFMREFLLGKTYFEHDFLAIQEVEKAYQEHLSGRHDHSRMLWLVFVFNYWYFKIQK